MRILALMLVFVLALALAGCGKKQPASFSDAKALAVAFDEAMSQGDFAAAADLFAMELWCKQNSTDWETYAPQQRREIMQKMTKDKTSELEGLGYQSRSYSVGEPQPVQGGQAVPLAPKGGGPGLVLNCVQTDAGYRIYSITQG